MAVPAPVASATALYRAIARVLAGKSDGTLLSLEQLGVTPEILLRAQQVANVPPIGEGVALTAAEWKVLAAWFESQYAIVNGAAPLPFDATLDFGAVARAVQVAKLGSQLTGLLSTDAGSGTGLFIQGIRPATVYAGGSSLSISQPVENWLATVATKGWNKGVFQIDLNLAGQSADVLNTRDNVVMLLTAIAEPESSPLLFEIKIIDSGGVPRLLHTLPLLYSLENVNVYRLPFPFLITKNQTATVDINFTSTGSSIPTLLGCQIVRRAYYTSE